MLSPCIKRVSLCLLFCHDVHFHVIPCFHLSMHCADWSLLSGNTAECSHQHSNAFCALFFFAVPSEIHLFRALSREASRMKDEPRHTVTVFLSVPPYIPNTPSPRPQPLSCPSVPVHRFPPGWDRSCGPVITRPADCRGMTYDAHIRPQLMSASRLIVTLRHSGVMLRHGRIG